MEQKHEEETVRIESDILRIKAEMDTLERQLTGKGLFTNFVAAIQSTILTALKLVSDFF